MKTNKYVLKIPYKNKLILYNTSNDMIVLCKYKDFLDKKTKSELIANDFYTDGDILLKKYLKVRKQNREQLDITISLTENCNLNCKYCSQSGVKRKTFISKKVIDNIIDYIDICIKKYNYNKVSIHLFGGEPLLMKKEIYYLNSCLQSRNIIVNYYMDTNGTLIDSEFINKIENVTFCITISNKKDHDNLRVIGNNTGTYDLIMKNIIKIQKYLDDNHKLMLRYNVNHNNIREFEEFLKSVKDLNIYYITIAYTNNYKENIKTNFLPYFLYKKWNSNKAVQLLMKYDYPIELPTASYYCKGYDRYSLKVFSDGSLGMCNAYNIKSSTKKIGDLLEEYKNTGNISKPFSKERNLDKIIDNKCLKCKYLFICNGKYYCRDKKCNFVDYNIAKYIKTYVKYSLKK